MTDIPFKIRKFSKLACYKISVSKKKIIASILFKKSQLVNRNKKIEIKNLPCTSSKNLHYLEIIFKHEGPIWSK